MQIIGRKEELAELKRYMESDKAEFIAVYGRRRLARPFSSAHTSMIRSRSRQQVSSAGSSRTR